MKREKVPKLPLKDASERGADFLAELVVYGISAGVLAIQQWDSSRKEHRKEAALAAKEAAKEAEAYRLQQLNEQRQWAELNKLSQTVAELQSRLSVMEQLQKRRWLS